MGAIGLFAAMVGELSREPAKASDDPLESMAAPYRRFAYIGARRTLAGFVLAESRLLAERLRDFRAEDLARLEETCPNAVVRVDRVRRCKADSHIAETWFGKDWQKDSGLFPDFLLAWDERDTFANGALIELKDTKGASVASFNSTIPTRYKSLEDVHEIMGSHAVSAAAELRDFPYSLAPDYAISQRRCFYLVRTHAGNDTKVRLSLVEGSFFETIPKAELLRRMWDQLIASSGLQEVQRPEVVESLADLSQAEIVQSRPIPQASVRPRLRLMAEVHPDANPHAYEPILPRTANLIVKAEWDDDSRWIETGFADEGMKTAIVSDGLVLTMATGTAAHLRYFRVTHKLNGPHLVLQYRMPGG